MTTMGKFIMVAGVLLLLVGGVLWLLGRMGYRGLPGDFVYESDHVRVYVPLASCLLLSAVLTLAWWLWHWLRL